MNRRAVCTAVIGGYEGLTEQPVADAGDVAFVCFTDDPDLTSSTWTVQLIEPLLPLDPVRSARDVKIRLHSYLPPDVEETLWIDNSVRLRCPPELLFDQWLAADDLAIPAHGFRYSVAAEFAEVALLGLDDTVRIYEQAAHYAELDPQGLDEHPLWTGMIARRASPAVHTFSARWMDHVLRYSRRDQLSVWHVLRATGIALHVVELDNGLSEWHEWPVSRRWKEAERRRYRPSFVPEQVAQAREQSRVAQAETRVAQAETRVAQVESSLLASREERDDLVAQLTWRESELDRLSGELANLKSTVGELRQVEALLDQVLRSRSFRATAGPRRVAAAARGMRKSRRE